MNELKKRGDSTGFRKTLKLKSAAGRDSLSTGELPNIRAPTRAGGWADEHIQRMQADMDALGFGPASIDGGRKR
jgi:hypothetical protein